MPFYVPDSPGVFPHPLLADQDGLLAFSDDIDSDSLLLSYRFGIFPWYHQDDPVCWWFTHPRCVVFPDRIKISKSMRKLLSADKFQFTINKAFDQVITQCKTVNRKNQSGTWITDKLQQCFLELHKLGYAHSAECWSEGELVGGLYGLSIGKVFYGESMFANQSNASKFAFIKFGTLLNELDFKLIDCQQETDHLISLGAELISSEHFLQTLRSNIFVPPKYLSTELA